MFGSLEFRTSLFQPLEPRLMLDIGGANPPAIVVGRTLSAYDVPDVQGHQETITLTVYNQAEHPISGVLLTDTLASGVTFANASQLPDQSGQQLAWSLGTIQPFDRASVTLTVSLTDPIPTTLDTGASAYGTLDAGMVNWTTAPAALRSTAITPALLASTPDANTTDPYVQEKAAELNYDPQQIFNFLQTQIGYNSYIGSLRGARGTLWSNAGNSLDDASLGIALMRASGIPAQYEEGTLATAQAQQLILSMFPASYQTVGYIPAGTQTADPANDPQLLSETKDHFWFQFDSGGGMQDADPLISGAAIGQTFTASSGTFTEVPDNLRAKTEVKLTAEMYSQLGSLFGLGGNGLSQTVVLDETFNDVDLVGRPLTVANDVASGGAGGIIFSSITNTYTPYIEIGDEATPFPGYNQIIIGTPYQETLTNFPLGNQILTGLFLDLTLSGPGATTETYTRALVDRIGYAARQGLIPASPSADPSAPPIISPLDTYTVSVLPGVQSPQPLAPITLRASGYDGQLPAVQSNASLLTSDMHNLLTLYNEAVIANFLVQSNAEAVNFSAGSVIAYFDRPRITVFSDKLNSLNGIFTFTMDLVQDSLRVVPLPGQNPVAIQVFNLSIGDFDNVLEDSAIPSLPGSVDLSTANVLQQAAAQGIPLVALSQQNASQLSTLAISEDAQARITSALASGLIVIVPSREVPIGTTSIVSWLEINPTTGALSGVLESGVHSAISEEAAVRLLAVGGAGLVLLLYGPQMAHAFGLLLEELIKDLGGLFHNASGPVPDPNRPPLVKPPNNIPLFPAPTPAAPPTKRPLSVPVLGPVPRSSPGPKPPEDPNKKKREQDKKNTISRLTKEIIILKASVLFAPLAPLLEFEKALQEDKLKDPNDPPVSPFLTGSSPTAPSTASALVNSEPPSLSFAPGAGSASNAVLVSAHVNPGSAKFYGQMLASWNTASASNFSLTSLEAGSGTVRNSQGNVVGIGNVSLSAASVGMVSITGRNAYNISGTGELAFYGPAESSLGVAGDWNSYTGAVSGDSTITISADDNNVLSVNGVALPAGTYTVAASEATFSGEGGGASSSFSGSVSLAMTDSSIDLGRGGSSLTIGGSSFDVSNGGALTGYSGTIDVVANGSGTNALTLSGSAANVLAVAPSTATLTTNENTAVSFDANVQTSFADAYNLTANAPTGWAVTIDSTGKVTVIPAPGTQGGTYPIQVIAQSTTNPDLISQATVEVTVTPTMPEMTLAVNPDPVFTVPFGGAQVPSAFRATMQNLGPTADTYNLTFSNVPSGFTILDSGTSDTVPAGQTGILGIYLQPNGTQLPSPGTQVSFMVTASSQNNPAITHSQTVAFTMPQIEAVTAPANPAVVNTTPGAMVGTTLSLNNVGNVAQNVALEVTAPAGLTASGAGSAAIGVGQSAVETLQFTPTAGTPLNTTLTATVNYASQPAQDVVTVLAVAATARSAVPQGFAEAGQSVDVSATLFDGVANPRQALVSYTVRNSAGAVAFTSTPVAVQFTAIAATATVDLGNFSTTGFAAGAYTLSVSVSEQNGTSIAGATGEGTLVIHSPVTASLTLDADTQAPGNATSTETLTLSSNDLLGSLAIDGTASSVVALGKLAYVAGTQDIAVVDISDAASPQLVTTFGSKGITQGGETLVRLLGTSDLVVASQDTSGGAANFNLLVYSLANPRSPTLVSSRPVNYRYVQDLFVTGSTALATTGGIYYADPGTITGQFGDVLSLDLTNPADPGAAVALSDSQSLPDGGAKNEHGVVAFSGSLAYVLGSTSTGDTPGTGSGVLQVVDYSDPTKLSLANTLTIPGTVQALAVAVQGNEALVVGSSGGWKNPFDGPTDIGLTGNVTLTLFDISDPANPRIVGSTLQTAATLRAGATLGKVVAVALGGGLFAVGNVEENGQSELLIVDATNPNGLAVNSVRVSDDVNGMTVLGDELLTASAGGLAVYLIGALTSQTVTAQVTVPINGGASIVPDSFSLSPTKVTTSANSETLEWDLNLAADDTHTIAWQTDLSGLAADQVLAAVTGATVATGGVTFNLPPLDVAVEPPVQTLQIPVQVVVPGAAAIADASVGAGQIGNTALANRLNDLSIALTNLVQNPTSAVYASQVQTSLTTIEGLLAADPYMNGLVLTITSDATGIAQASTASAVQAAVVQLGNDLSTLSQYLTDEGAYGFTLSLSPNALTAVAGAPADFLLNLQNNGSQAATYNLSAAGLPGNVTVKFTQNGNSITSVTVQPGQDLFGGPNGVTLELIETGGGLFTTDFTVTVTAQGGSEITRSASGTLTAPAALVSVVNVDVTPPFVATSGGLVDVTTKVITAVAQQQQALASYTVVDANNNVVFTSTPVPLTLTVQSSLTTVDLGDFNLSGLAAGIYTIDVTITDTSGKPIAGTAAQGSLMVGTPVTASLTESPAMAPSGNPTVNNTLTINSQVSFPNPLTLDGQVATTPTSTTVSLDTADNLAYVAGTNGIDIVDISNPASPQKLSTFAQNQIVQGGFTVVRQDTIAGTNYLVVGTTIILNANKTTILIYSLSDPRNPQLVSSTAINYVFMSDLLVQGNTVLVPTDGFTFFGSGDIFDQFGSVLAVDISDPTAPKLAGELYNNRGAPAGGDTNQFGGTIVNSQVAYIASTTSTGGNTSGGVGRMLVLDYSDPTNLKSLGEVDIPGTQRVLDVSIQGNRALVVGSTGGWLNPFDNGTTGGTTGNLTLSVLDISNPTSPQLIGTTAVTNGKFPNGVDGPHADIAKLSVLPLSNGQFAVSEAILNGNPVLLLVDPTDPNNIVVTTDPVPALVDEMAVSGNLLYTAGSAGLLIYNIGTIQSIPITASVKVPNHTGVSVVPGSFNIPPTQTVPGTNFTTYSWTQSLAFGESQPTLTWQTQVNDLAAGEARQVTLGGDVQFVSQGTPGTIPLAPTAVAGEPILAISPASETVAPAAPATYDVTVTNLAGMQDTFDLSVLGVPAGWANLPASVTVAANSSVDVSLVLTSDAFAALGDDGFTVVANDGAGALGSVAGDLVLAGQPPAVDTQSHGIVVTLTPATASAGQGTSALYTVQLTNTGSADDTFTLTPAGLPANVKATFSQTTLDVPPGASNFRDVTLTLTPQVGAAAGNDPFAVHATSTTDASVTATADGTLNVLAAGVSVTLTPSSAAPGSTYQLKVTNTGTATDTFKLSLANAGALVSILGSNQVTLAPGASQTVPVTTSSAGFAVQGAVPLTGIATSQTNSAVKSQATANLTIAPTQSMTAAFNPTQQTLAAPGATTLTLQVQNTGNSEDSYSATIVSATGGVTASLIGLDGRPAQSVPIFRLAGLSTGALTLDVSASAAGQGTVTVLVQSLTTGSIQSSPVATLTVGATTSGAGIVPRGVPFQGYEFSPPTNVTVVTFTDGDGSLPAADFSASIDWGDGATSAGSVTRSGGTYAVTGSHAYLDEGHFTVRVDIQQTAGPIPSGTMAAAVASTATVHEELLAEGTVGTPNENYIQEIYRDLFGRQAEPQGRDYWVAKLTQGSSRSELAQQIIQLALPQEFQRDAVDALYQQYLGRAPDAAGKQFWTDYLYGGGTIEEMSQALVSSPEYSQARGGGTKAGFLTVLFHDALGRQIDVTALAYFQDQMSKGMTTSDVADILFSSDEYHRIRVDALFEQFMGRAADENALSYFALQLDQGARDESLIAQLISSDEYFNHAQI